MGTQVQYKSYLAGYNPMRDLNDDSNSNSWPVIYGDNTLTNGQYYNTGFVPREIADAYPGYDKDALKQKMLEHEATFKTQVHELHRLYRTQMDMMEEIKRNELHRQRASIEPSSSSSIRGSQAQPSEDARKWHLPSYPLVRSTILGAEIVNSPLSCTKGKNTLASPAPYQNGSTFIDLEVSEARPSKVRKTLFDLHLPADEYIDPEDAEQQDTRTSSFCSFTPNREYQIASGSSMKRSLEGVPGGKIGGQQQSFMRLADLNEPVEIEEATAPSSIKIFGHSTCNGGTERIDLNDVLQKSLHGSRIGSVNILSTENKVNEREWLPFMHNSGHSRNNLSPISGGIQQDKLYLPSTPGQFTLNQPHPSRMWQERAGRGLEAPNRTRDYTSPSHLEPVPASQVPNPYPFLGSSNVASTWSQYVASWGKPADNFTHKLASYHKQPPLISSAQNHEISGDKWYVGNSSSLNPGLGSDRSSRNGFYHGSSSRSKDCFSSVGFDYLNGRSDKTASERLSNYGLETSPKGSSYINMKPGIDVNLNVALPKDLFNGEVRRHDLEIIDGKSKPEDSRGVFPWLRAKPACNSEASNSRREMNSMDSSFVQASPKFLFGKKIDTVCQAFNGTPASTNHESRPEKETSEKTQSVNRIFGFPIFDKSPVSSIASLHPTQENAKPESKSRLIDINVACDALLLESDDEIAVEDTVVEKGLNQNAFEGRNFIDLNCCISEDEEDPPVPSVASNTSAATKFVFEIDLEASPAPEAEEDILPEEENVQEMVVQSPENVQEMVVQSPEKVQEMVVQSPENVQEMVVQSPENVQEMVVQSPDRKTEQIEDEILKSAAEAIVDISSLFQHINQENDSCPPSEGLEEESLLWFADVAICIADKFEKKSRKVNSSFKEMDDFEAMIVQLEETKEEDYMPKPFIPEFQYVEERENNLLPTRTRRGQARRGRQRRDFQRDILPGLSSLSRHEVTEDLQTFGGLMKATGHSWNSGVTRRNGGRNGGARGRKRAVVESTSTPAAAAAPTPTPTPVAACTPPPLVQQLNNIETGLNDKSLTGWGKTTRRPRRQRCPAGNPPTVQTT